jgi:putative sterol carrier protein
MPAESTAGSAEVAHDQEYAIAAQEVLARMASLKTQGVDPRFARFSGNFVFDVEGVGAWKITYDHGTRTVLDGLADAECVIHTDPVLFMQVARGEQNLLTAYMQGRLVIEGDMALAQKLNSIMPAHTKAMESKGGAA